MNRSLLSFSVLLFACVLSNAQSSLLDSRRSSLITYIYEFTPQQVRDHAFEKIEITDSTLYISPADSFYTDSAYTKHLPKGTYCFVWIQEMRVRYDIKTVSDLRISTSENTHGLWINVYDNQGKICENATVY